MISMQKQTARTRFVHEVMHRTVITVNPEMTVRDLIHVLVDNSIHGVPVLDEDGRAMGVVSMTDVLQLASHEAEIPAGQIDFDPAVLPEEVGGDEDVVRTHSLVPFTEVSVRAPVEATFDAYLVRDIMTETAFALDPNDTLEFAVEFMLRGHIHRALVAENGILVGIITPFDVLRSIEW